MRYGLAASLIVAMPAFAKVTVLNTLDTAIGAEDDTVPAKVVSSVNEAAGTASAETASTIPYSALEEFKLIDKYSEVDVGLGFQNLDESGLTTLSQRLHIGFGIKVFELLYVGIGANGWIDYHVFEIDEEDEENPDDDPQESFSGISVGLDARLHIYPGINSPYIRYGDHCYVVSVSGLEEPWERDACSGYWGAGYSLVNDTSPIGARTSLYLELLVMDFEDADAVNLVVGARF